MSYPHALTDALMTTSRQMNRQLDPEKITYGRGIVVGVVSALCWLRYQPEDAIRLVADSLPQDFIRDCWPENWNDLLPRKS